ncbi:hypothetical protein [Sphingomonas longa]|uniref:hypothetical protein n=1 Tax=Sphingomonas longa TaxID=2778730 RepID=UPI00194E3415|nr:hypothetical protein [Sphingomonas sp. BT552]
MVVIVASLILGITRLVGIRGHLPASPLVCLGLRLLGRVCCLRLLALATFEVVIWFAGYIGAPNFVSGSKHNARPLNCFHLATPIRRPEPASQNYQDCTT